MGIFSAVINRTLLENFVSRFTSSDLPKYKDVNFYLGLYKVDVYDEKPKFGTMHENVCSGISNCKFEAFQIALSEYFERKAIIYNKVNYSNGCAAQPVYLSRKTSLKIAEQRGYNESLERYAFYKWFNDYSIKHTWIKNSKNIFGISNLVPYRRAIGQIKIEINYKGFLILSYLELGNGLIFGIALDQKISKARLRSESELLRNSATYVNSRNSNKLTETDKDILAIAERGSKFLKRIESPGIKKIKFPAAKKTCELSHEFKENIVVVRSTIEDVIHSKKTLCDNY